MTILAMRLLPHAAAALMVLLSAAALPTPRASFELRAGASCSDVDCQSPGRTGDLIPGDLAECTGGYYCQCSGNKGARKRCSISFPSIFKRQVFNPDKQKCEAPSAHSEGFSCESWVAEHPWPTTLPPTQPTSTAQPSTSTPKASTTFDPWTDTPPSSSAEPTTELPPSSSAEPTTELPPSSSAEPTTELPPSSSAEPTTELPPSSTAEPTTELPPSSSAEPTTDLPPSSSAEPTTELPPSSSTEPTTELPPPSSVEPTTGLPPSSSAEPTTNPPSPSTVDPSTHAPPSSTAAPRTETPPSFSTAGTWPPYPIPQTCTSAMRDIMLPHPKHCNQYIRCYGGCTWVMTCAPGTLFSYAQQDCDFPWTVDCKDK